jgi:hypothetical protein
VLRSVKRSVSLDWLVSVLDLRQRGTAQQLPVVRSVGMLGVVWHVCPLPVKHNESQAFTSSYHISFVAY